MSAVADEDEDEVRGKDSSVEFHRQRAAWAEEEGEDRTRPARSRRGRAKKSAKRSAHGRARRPAKNAKHTRNTEGGKKKQAKARVASSCKAPYLATWPRAIRIKRTKEIKWLIHLTETPRTSLLQPYGILTCTNARTEQRGRLHNDRAHGIVGPTGRK
jgi:hypothetical protein